MAKIFGHGFDSSVLSGYVPYVGATTTLNLGANNFIVDTNTFFVDASTNQVGIGTASPASKIQIDSGNATASAIKFTAGTTTGTTSTDGFDIGISTTGAAEIRQREAQAMLFFTSNVNYMSLASNGPTLTLDSQANNSVNAGTIIFRTLNGSETCTLTFDASANFFRQQYGATEVYRISATGQMQWRDGSVGAPAISFLNDTNTGMYRYGVDGLALVTGGSERVRINNTGIGLMGSNPDSTYQFITPSGRATSSLYGWSVQNSTDYLITSFRAPDFSEGGFLESEGKLFFQTGTNYSGWDTPDMVFNMGQNWGTYNSGNFSFNGHFNFDGGLPSEFFVYAGGTSTGSAGGIHLYGGQCIGADNGGNIHLNGGNSDFGTGGEVFINGGLGGTSDGAVRIQSNTSGVFSMFGATGSAQVNTFITPASLSSGSGPNIKEDDLFDGYTVAQVVAALRAYGFLA